jgi:hypothetical protein
MQSIFSKHTILLPLAAFALLSANSFATSPTFSTGVDTNNNISTSGGTTVDSNWQFTGFYDSYGLTRGQVFGSGVSDPNGAIGYNISSAAESAATTGHVDTNATLVTGGNRPGWYNPGTGAQWISDVGTQSNGGIPINPPGNYQYTMNLSPYVNSTGGLVTITIADINADNHFELAIGNASAEEYMAIPFATQETWGSKGPSLTITFSPLDGTDLNVIIANNNDQVNGAGQYVYTKNPTGFLISGMTISQASGPTPKQDPMVNARTANGSAPSGSGTVYHNLVAAPEPSTWVIMASFLLIALCKFGSMKPIRE